MIQKENVVSKITLLLEQGALAKSRCSDALLQALSPLIQAGVLVDQRSGAGRCLVVCNTAALREFSRREFPELEVRADLGSRVAGVARFRDSKALVSDTPVIVSVRAWGQGVLTKDGHDTEAAVATERHGTFSFLLREGSSYALTGKCALVENPAVFAQFERMQLPVGVVIYGHGRASNRLLNWLTARDAADFSLLHLPDYDPVGLSEFERLRARLGARVRLHIPVGLEQRFARFSNPALLGAPNSRVLLAGLRPSTSLEVQRVLTLIHRHNAGLEQEALLI